MLPALLKVRNDPVNVMYFVDLYNYHKIIAGYLCSISEGILLRLFGAFFYLDDYLRIVKAINLY